MRLIRLGLLSVLLIARRAGWFSIGTYFFFFAAIVTSTLSIPTMRTMLREQKVQILALETALSASPSPVAVPPSTSKDHLDKFYGQLGEKPYVEQQLKTLFAIASKNGLTILQGEYKLDYSKEGQLFAYRVQLPLKGSYQAIRQFCEQTLLRIPFASLDDLDFKREGSKSNELEAKLRFSFYLGDVRPAAFELATQALLIPRDEGGL